MSKARTIAVLILPVIAGTLISCSVPEEPAADPAQSFTEEPATEPPAEEHVTEPPADKASTCDVVSEAILTGTKAEINAP